MEVYLDNSATTKPRKEVIDEINYMLKNAYGNPSSLHRMGFEAEKRITDSRKTISNCLGCREEEVYFTASGTESNNIAIQGIVNRFKKRGNHLITTKIEHSSVINIFKHYESKGFKVTYVDVDDRGIVDLKQLEENITDETILVAVMLVNNEIGTIQPIRDIKTIINKKNKDTKLHIDGVQALGKIPVNVKKFAFDTFAFSGHKIHGPKGIAGLYIKKGLNLSPIIYGGNQESGIRSGTENVPGIVGLGKAVEIDMENFQKEKSYIANLKKYFLDRVRDEVEDIKVNSIVDEDKCAPHILNISFLNIRGEVLLHYLEEKGIFVSTGSACSSNNKSKTKSRVLDAIGLSDNEVEGAIRFSFSYNNTKEEIDYTVKCLKNSVDEIRKITMR
ncbi:cysteine desulfurase family protein [Sporosalibacterium faouarense]|uniref:cysteine desulfurase family protein n=1 Tax=Sporosalibacterium faouarense TaxID=516123 RepID=UPI00141C858A|nr:cysteine desulfurase family protein [Sporosalibacterium faouarense]MTI49239.1 cysteine desulfurase [Bacillota bacterium]